jgi:hypothetical protein
MTQLPVNRKPSTLQSQLRRQFAPKCQSIQISSATTCLPKLESDRPYLRNLVAVDCFAVEAVGLSEDLNADI